MNGALEISLETRACKYLIDLGANPVKEGMDGRPDRQILWGGGRHFWFEFKKVKTGKARPGQKVWAKYLNGIGDEIHFVETMEQVTEVAERWRATYGEPTARRDAAFR